MLFKEIQDGVLKNAEWYEKEFDVKFDIDLASMKLVEEVGEFMQSVITHTKRCRPAKFTEVDVSKHEAARELSDVIGMAFICARELDIDLESAIKEKWLKMTPAN